MSAEETEPLEVGDVDAAEGVEAGAEVDVVSDVVEAPFTFAATAEGGGTTEEEEGEGDPQV